MALPAMSCQWDGQRRDDAAGLRAGDGPLEGMSRRGVVNLATTTAEIPADDKMTTSEPTQLAMFWRKAAINEQR